MRPHEPVTRAFFATKSSLTQRRESKYFSQLNHVLGWTALVTVAALCGTNWARTLGAIHDLYLAIPFWDYWREPQHLSNIQHLDLRFLWSQHNEHRIVFPEITFIIDVLWFRGKRIFPIVLSCACYAAGWVLLTYYLTRDKQLARVEKSLSILLAGAVIGWKGSALAVADPFLLQWTMMSAAALAAFVLLTGMPHGVLGRRFVALIVCAVVGTYSCGGGLLIWPVLIAIGGLRKLSRRQLLALLVTAALTIVTYFIGYHFTEKGNWLNLLHHPLYSIGFIAMYMSMPFGGLHSIHFGVYIGAGALLLFAALVYVLVRSRDIGKCAAIVLCAWYVLTLLSAILTGTGRMDPRDTTFTAAKPPRYLVAVMLSWGALFALLVWTVAVRRWRLISPAVTTLLLTVLLFIAQRKLSWWWSVGLRPYVAGQITELSLENEVFDPQMVQQGIFPSAAFVSACLPPLRNAHLSIYAQKQLLGEVPDKSLTEKLTPAEITRTIPVSSGLEVIGVAKAKDISKVVLRNAPGEIVGTGRSLPFGLPSELAPPDVPASRTWIAFVPERYAGERFSAWTY